MAIPALCSELVRCRACWRHTKTRQRSRRSDFANLRFKAHLHSVADGVAESSRTTGCDRAWTRRKDQNARPVRRQGLRFRITKGHIRCQYHRFGDPGNGTRRRPDAARLVQGLLAGPSSSSRCEPLLSRYCPGRTHACSHDESDTRDLRGLRTAATARVEPHSHGALSERTWPAVVTLAAATNRDPTHWRAALSRASPRTRLQAGARNRDSAGSQPQRRHHPNSHEV